MTQPVGLCKTCRYVRIVRSGRNATYFLCERSKTDRRFEKYPRIPVLQCVGYESSNGVAGNV